MPPTRHNADDADLHTALRSALQEELAQMAPDNGLAELHARLRADAAHTPVRPPVTTLAALRDWFTRWPTALASLIIVVQAGLLAWQMQPEQEAAWRGVVVTGVNGTPMTTLAVRFTPQASLQTLGDLLNQLQTTATAGPDANGVWSLRVPTTRHKAALSILRASPIVQDAMAP